MKGIMLDTKNHFMALWNHIESNHVYHILNIIFFNLASGPLYLNEHLHKSWYTTLKMWGFPSESTVIFVLSVSLLLLWLSWSYFSGIYWMQLYLRHWFYDKGICGQNRIRNFTMEKEVGQELCSLHWFQIL